MMNVVMLIVVMLSVMVPRKGLSKRISKEFFLIFEIFDADLVHIIHAGKTSMAS
jgi:hypothetical protein